MTVQALLILLCAFQLKHFLGDFVFQNEFILRNRRFWGHPGGLLHVLIHGVLTLPILLAAGVATPLLLAIVIGEAVFHYHVDWLKDLWVNHKGWSPSDRQFWWLTGADQAVHQISYLFIAALLAA